MRIADLRRVNAASIRAAGPRYAPGLDATAPNLTIRSLVVAFDTVGLTDAFDSSVIEVRDAFRKAWADAPRELHHTFRRRRRSPDALFRQLTQFAEASPDRSHARLAASRLTASAVNRTAQRQSEQALNALMAAQPDTEERKTLDYKYGQMRRFANAASIVATFLRSASIELVANNALLLLGGWGMGKTHALCDLTETRMRSHLPTLFFLAQRIPFGSNPLDGLCQATGLAATRRELLRELDRMGRHRRTRAVLVIDAINEGDRVQWKQSVTAIVQELSQYRHVGLIISCRQPFDQQILSKRATKKFVVVYHQGFSEIEFDAQVSFFQHYNIPSPQVPLITPEYSRPLFLQLLCQAIATLSTAGKHRQLRSFASGQKGMTYLLEYFCKKIGGPIEADFGLQGGKCWQIVKGQPISHGGATFGVASRMATELRDYLTWDECLLEVVEFVDGPHRRHTARRLVRRMITDGILAEDLRWENNGYVEVIRFPYQRFGDHIIAWSLLRHLNTGSQTTIRRSFYRNKPLGRIFELSPDRRTFQRPGFASAIMLEFPERIAGHVPPDQIEQIFICREPDALLRHARTRFWKAFPGETPRIFLR